MLEMSLSQWLSTKFRDRRRATSGMGMGSLAGSTVLEKETVKPHPMLKRCKTACISPQEPNQIQLHSSGYTISKAGLHFICYTASRTSNHDQHHSAALSCRTRPFLCSHLSCEENVKPLLCSTRLGILNCHSGLTAKREGGAGWCYSPKVNFTDKHSKLKNNPHE